MSGFCDPATNGPALSCLIPLSEKGSEGASLPVISADSAGGLLLRSLFAPRLLILLLVMLGGVFPPVSVCRASVFGEFTIRDEVELGRKFNMMIRASMPVIEDPEVTGYVQGLVDRIAAGMPPQPFELRTAVIRNGALNAFATAGGGRKNCLPSPTLSPTA